MTLLPIADVLLIEVRRCRCGSIFEAPAPVLHRMLKTPINEPEKLELRALKYDPVKMEERADSIPQAIRCIRYIEVPILQCHRCWVANESYDRAVLQRPLPPTTSMNGLQYALVSAAEKGPKSPKAASPRKPILTVDQLAAEFGL